MLHARRWSIGICLVFIFGCLSRFRTHFCGAFFRRVDTHKRLTFTSNSNTSVWRCFVAHLRLRTVLLLLFFFVCHIFSFGSHLGVFFHFCLEMPPVERPHLHAQELERASSRLLRRWTLPWLRKKRFVTQGLLRFPKWVKIIKYYRNVKRLCRMSTSVLRTVEQVQVDMSLINRIVVHAGLTRRLSKFFMTIFEFWFLHKVECRWTWIQGTGPAHGGPTQRTWILFRSQLVAAALHTIRGHSWIFDQHNSHSCSQRGLFTCRSSNID